MTDPDWWKGKCLGRIGYFPSKYCARLTAGEKPLQVIQNLQLSDGERNDGIVTLLRDQIVVQVIINRAKMAYTFAVICFRFPVLKYSGISLQYLYNTFEISSF